MAFAVGGPGRWGALAGQKKLQEAEPLLVAGNSGMKEREAKIPPAAKTSLTAGSYDFKVIGRNSRGVGPESPVSTIVVA